MLECLERWTALASSATISPSTTTRSAFNRDPDSAIPGYHPGEVLVIPGSKLDLPMVLDDQRPVAIELELVDPVLAPGSDFTICAAMGTTNAGGFRVGADRIVRAGRDLLFVIRAS